MSQSEFSRMVDIRQANGSATTLTADAAERAALAKRFGIVAIDRLDAAITIDRDGPAVTANGTLETDIVQACAVSAEDFAIAVREPVALRFVPATPASAIGDIDAEIDAEAIDEIEYTGTAFDLGEAVAQTLALVIDPFATGPNAEDARRRAGLLGESEAGPFAALKGWKGAE